VGASKQYEGVNLVARLDATGAVEDTWLYDRVDDPLRLQRGGLTYYYELDLAGNVRRLRDATGADLGGYRYSAFGVTLPADAATPATAVDQLLRWKGRPFESAAGGVYDMRARWWSPAAGQFLTVDRLEYFDATSTLWGWGNQSPVRWSDPSGNCPACLGSAGFGAVAGGVAGGIYAALTTNDLSPSGFFSAVGQGALQGAGAGALFGLGLGLTGASTLTVGELTAGAGALARAAVGSGASGAGCAVRTASVAAAAGATARANADEFSPAEMAVVEAVKKIPLGQLQEAFDAGGAELSVDGRTILVDPGVPSSGFSLFGEDGFVVGNEAFSSEAELTKTLLHETYRLAMTQSAGGLSQGLATSETQDAADFAERAFAKFFGP
jgi:RHS repeat-associated protein